MLSAGEIAAIGITNQRETCLLWDRRTSQPIHRAIVWQDRRTAEICRRPAGGRARAGDHRASTGSAARSVLSRPPRSPGCSITSDGARALAEAGHLAFGTGRQFSAVASDRRQGARHRCDQRLAHAALRHRPRAPSTTICCGSSACRARSCRRCATAMPLYGVTEPSILGAAVPICGVAGDQQAAAIGQACFAPGMVKATYGTGCFAVLNTGEGAGCLQASAPHHACLPARRRCEPMHWRAPSSIAGAAVQWLRDGLRLIASAAESGTLAAAADPGQDVYLVPALRRPRGALLAARGARRPVRLDACHRAQRDCPRRARGRLLPNR